jgi:hypothetical protein
VQALKNNDYSSETVGRFLKGNRTLTKPMNDALDALIAFQVRTAKAEYNQSIANYTSARAISIVPGLADHPLDHRPAQPDARHHHRSREKRRLHPAHPGRHRR